ncbi:MAG TPA: polysaccharide deacetylase family protein [Armatimonadota bacterium]
MRTILKSFVLNAFARLGIPRRLHRARFSDRLTILMYHGVVRSPLPIEDWCFLQEAAFREQMHYLKAHFDVLPLSDAVSRLREGRISQPTAAITFDDGYQCVHDVCLPILSELGLPATVYLTTAPVGTDETIWFCRLIDGLSETSKTRLEWDGREWDLAGPAAKSRACAELQAALKERSPAELERELAGILRALGVAVDRHAPPGSPFRLLDPPSIQAMAAGGLIAFGAHTHTHAILSRVPPEERRGEISRSVSEVERLAGRPCSTFAYPNGRSQDYDAPTMAALADLGIETAVTTIEGPNDRLTPPLELRRYGIGSDLSSAGFQMLIHHTSSMLKREAS